MNRFELHEEFSAEPEGRLRAFIDTLWKRLVPSNGECVSVQGELVRVNGRLTSELFRNGMCNYYGSGTEEEESLYVGWAVFLLDTLIENEGEANRADELAPLVVARGLISADCARERHLSELVALREEETITEAQQRELDALEDGKSLIDWEPLLNRAERCAANWCLANPLLFDRKGMPVEEGGVRDVSHLFEPPPPAPKCPLCGGRGFVQKDERSFPELCGCKR